MRKLMLVGLLILLSLVAIQPALAVDPWECDFDFTVAENDFAVASPWGSWSEGTGYTTGDGTFSAPELTGIRSIIVNREVPSSTWTQVEMTFDLTKGHFTPTTPVGVIFLNETLVQSVAEIDITDGTDKTLTWDGSLTVTEVQLQVVTSHDQTDPITYAGAATLKSVHLEGTGTSPCATYIKPLLSEDEDLLTENLNQLSTPGDNAVFAFSFTPGQPVFAAADGTIVEMRLLQPDTDCDENFNRADLLFVSAPCMLLIPDTSDPYFPDGARTETQGGNVWFVRLLAGTGEEFIYFVEAADVYLTEGQPITAGCVMGRTFQVEPGSNPPEFLTEPGLAIVVVRNDGVIIPSVNLFSIEPVESAACNINPDNANCMGDVQLNDPAEWQSSSGVIWNEPGYTILGGFNAHIRTTLNLDPAQKPELVVVLRGHGGGNGNFELTLGQTTIEFSVSEAAGFQTFTIPGAEHEPDGDFYTVRVLNDGTSTLDIQSICVRFTDDGEGNPVDNPDPPPTCIFANNTFNDGTGSWSVSSTEPGTGEIHVQSGGTFAQNVSVPAGTYDLVVVAAIWHYNQFTPDDQDTDDVDIEYDFGAGSVPLDTHTYGEFAQNNNVVVFSTSLVVASDTTDDFVFEVTLNSPATGVRGLAIRSVCIGNEGEGGSGEGEGGDGDGGLFEPNCTGDITTPSGSDVGVWLSWHWSQLNKFYRCELMVLLNSLYKFLQQSWITTTWSIRWSQAATVYTVNWFGRDFVGWLGGHLNNIAIGQVTTINTESGDTCGNLFCLLQTVSEGIQGLGTSIVDGIRDVLELLIGGLHDLLSTLLGMIQQLLNFFLGAAGLVIGLAVQFVALLFRLMVIAAELFQLLIQAVVTVVNAWIQATPEDLIPSCALDQTSARCMIFYITERTVFTESGALFMPTLAGGIYLALILWVIRRVTSALRDLGTLS
jgi:hypothetical protein